MSSQSFERFNGPWLVANRVALVGLLIVLVAEHKPRGTALSPTVAALGAIIFASITAHAIYSGQLAARGIDFSKAKHPVAFWVVVTTLGLCSVRMLFVAFQCFAAAHMTTESLPEIFCDFNARMTENGYSIETVGSKADLAKLGLTLEQAVGHRFILNGGPDANEHGEPADIMCRGTIVKDAHWGYLAVSDLTASSGGCIHPSPLFGPHMKDIGRPEAVARQRQVSGSQRIRRRRRGPSFNEQLY